MPLNNKSVNVGIVTYTSIYCNFTNYGTVLQAWALMKAIKKLSCPDMNYIPYLVNYCPDSMKDKSPLDPFRNMWNKDKESIRMCKATMPAIKENFKKIQNFYKDNMNLTKFIYDIDNYSENTYMEPFIDKFICGSDSIYDKSEFGMDRFFYADIEFMKNNSIAYAPSFQDCFDSFTSDELEILKKYMTNFVAVGIRDKYPLEWLKNNICSDIVQVCDPTLLLSSDNYTEITAEKQEKEKYLLYYSRRYNPEMEKFVEKTAKEKKLKVIEISLRAVNADKHCMKYSAGVEEFLSLVKYADCVVTNSYHCMIFSIIFKRNFYVFSREHCDSKIKELCDELGLSDRFFIDSNALDKGSIDYNSVSEKLNKIKKKSISFLRESLKKLCCE